MGVIRPPTRRNPCHNSFSADTHVLMADGTTKPIEQVEVGDVVLATDPETGQTEPKKVTATIIGEGDKDLVQVSVGLQGPAPYDVENVVVATGGHPFWVTSTDQWVDAADLQVGQWLQTSTAAEVPITAIEQYPQYTRVYNLTIADIHTYYVLAGDTPVLVHNCPDGGVSPKGPGARWPTQQGGNCKACAEQIQSQIGGDMVRITPRGGRVLGPSTNNPHGDWFDHWVVVRDGRVYDSFTGPRGMTPGQYKAQFEYNDAINFGF